ncbi:MAG: hypothetical protein ACP5M0_01310 [Desulfomonilaceae bacterium]
MLKNRHILIIGARAGGYGEGIAKAAVRGGATVFGTTLNPEEPREAAFFQDLGISLVEIPLRYDADKRAAVQERCREIGQYLKARGVDRLDAVVHAVAGGFPRQPSVMKAVGDILRGKQTFSDMATLVRKNVYYVNAISFQDTIAGLQDVCDDQTQYVALTYRGELPYFISDTKRHLEYIAARLAREGKRTLVVALPEAWTQSSQFFTGIELAIVYNYLQMKDIADDAPLDMGESFQRMESSLAALAGWSGVLDSLRSYLHAEWATIASSQDSARLWNMVQELFARMRKDGTFPVLRKAVEIISEFVREGSGVILAREFLAGNKFNAGDVRQVFCHHFVRQSEVPCAPPRPPRTAPAVLRRRWVEYDKEEIRQTLKMYGANFLFLDKVIMEAGGFRNGLMGFGKYTVPSPETNPILRDHFVGMPLFGGHLQMEAVAQLGTFMIMKLLKDRRLVPILTGTEFPDLNTMAPPGETLTFVGVMGFTNKRDLWLDAFIENRYARSKGVIRGMVLNERVVRKMTASFAEDMTSDDDTALAGWEK